MLAIVSNSHAEADQIDLVKAELEKLIPITRAEEGCIQYDLHQDNDNPAHFPQLRCHTNTEKAVWIYRRERCATRSSTFSRSGHLRPKGKPLPLDIPPPNEWHLFRDLAPEN
jgi:hypothetical protein